eukprot:s3137_g11.t1
MLAKALPKFTLPGSCIEDDFSAAMLGWPSPVLSSLDFFKRRLAYRVRQYGWAWVSMEVSVRSIQVE